MSNIFPSIPTTLDLNGPELEFTTNPVDFTTSVADGTATFTAVAQATFPVGQSDRNENSGTIAYQWLRDGVPLINGTNVSGATSSTLTLSGLTNPDDTGSTILCKADYVPSAYDAGLTGNAYNEPITSATAILTVSPTISSSTVANASTNEIENTTITASATVSDNTDNQLSYSWFVDGVSLSTNPEGFIFSGNNTKNLTITKNAPGFHKLTCRISHPTANPAFITTNESNLEIKATRDIIRYQIVNENSTNDVRSGDRNFSNAPGTLFFQADPDAQSTGQKFQTSKVIFLHAVERDVTLKITMAGAAGENLGSYSGGQGGLSVFKVTLKKGIEHAIRLGVNSDQSFNGIIGGDSGVGGGGGGLAVMYRKAQVIAVCGGGGGAGTGGDGGNGGGIGIAGQNGGSGGNGGALVGIDLLSGGFDNSGTTGGALSECTGSCDDIGLSRYTNASGTTYSSTDSIERGYRSNQGFRTNGGDSSGNQGAGGAGARGGSAATSNNGGGGGGSGYQSSEIELLSSTTLPGGTGTGGNAEVGFVGIEVFDEDASKEPSIPDPTLDIRTVDFVITRNTTNENFLTLTKDGSGFGPDTIQLGPESGTVSVDIGEGTIYNQIYSGTLTAGGTSIDVKLSGNTLFADDNIGAGPDPLNPNFADGDYNDLTVTPSLGQFTSFGNYFKWTANWAYPFQAAPTPPTGTAEEDVRRVTFTISESTPYFNSLTFKKSTKNPGTGPDSFTVDTNTSKVTIDVGENVTYIANSKDSSTTSGGTLRSKISGNCLFVDDNQGNISTGYDNDFNDLIVTPNLGEFSDTNVWRANWDFGSTTTTPSPPSEPAVDASLPIASLSVSTDNITIGESFVLAWISSNGSSYEITVQFPDGNIFTAVNNPGANGNTTVTPGQIGTYIYTYTVTGATGLRDSDIRVVVVDPLPPTASLDISSVSGILSSDGKTYTAAYGENITLEWSSTNGTEYSLTGVTDPGPDGTTIITPVPGESEYAYTVKNSVGDTSIASITVRVQTTEDSPLDPDDPLYGGQILTAVYFHGMNHSWNPNTGQHFYHLNYRQNSAFVDGQVLLEENFMYVFHPTTYPTHSAITTLGNSGINGPTPPNTDQTQSNKKRAWNAQYKSRKRSSLNQTISRPIGSWPIYRFESSNFTAPNNKFYTFSYDEAERVIRDGGPYGIDRGFKQVDHDSNPLGDIPKPCYYVYRRFIHPDDEGLYTGSGYQDLAGRAHGLAIHCGDDGKTNEKGTYQGAINDRVNVQRTVAGKGTYTAMKGKGYANCDNCEGRRYYGYMILTPVHFPPVGSSSVTESTPISGGLNIPGVWESDSTCGYKIESRWCSSG